MKTPIKISLLLFAVLLAVGGVLIYVKTSVTPPQSLKFDNQYSSFLHKNVEDYRNSAAGYAEADFNKFSDLSSRLLSEERIDNQTYEKEFGEFLGLHAPRFAEWCFSLFHQPVWNKNDLNNIESKISLFKSIKNPDGSKTLLDNFPPVISQLNEVSDVLGNYKQASAVAASGYVSLNDSRDKISRARDFAQDPYLRNNQSLVASLNNLPSKLENAHFNSLKSKVSSLAHFENYSESNYENLSDRVLEDIREYKDNAHQVYGTSHSVDDLKNKASEYYYNARDYYEMVQYNSVNSVNSWN